MRDSGGAYNRFLGSAQLGSGFETWRGQCGLKGVGKEDRTIRIPTKEGKKENDEQQLYYYCLLEVNVVRAKRNGRKLRSI